MQLTSSNLAALEEGTSLSSPEAIIKSYLFKIGVSKCAAYDYIYSEERRARFINWTGTTCQWTQTRHRAQIYWPYDGLIINYN